MTQYTGGDFTPKNISYWGLQPSHLHVRTPQPLRNSWWIDFSSITLGFDIGGGYANVKIAFVYIIIIIIIIRYVFVPSKNM